MSARTQRAMPAAETAAVCWAVGNASATVRLKILSTASSWHALISNAVFTRHSVSHRNASCCLPVWSDLSTQATEDQLKRLCKCHCSKRDKQAPSSPAARGLINQGHLCRHTCSVWWHFAKPRPTTPLCAGPRATQVHRNKLNRCPDTDFTQIFTEQSDTRCRAQYCTARLPASCPMIQ